MLKSSFDGNNENTHFLVVETTIEGPFRGNKQF